VEKKLFISSQRYEYGGKSWTISRAASQTSTHLTVLENLPIIALQMLLIK
jgi:hypothetical protein